MLHDGSSKFKAAREKVGRRQEAGAGGSPKYLRQPVTRDSAALSFSCLPLLPPASCSSVGLLSYEGRHVQVVGARRRCGARREVCRLRVARRGGGRARGVRRRADVRYLLVEARGDD